MRLAIFSDIHGNLEALEAFLNDSAGREVDNYICLGDVVGYGASPGQCIERLRSLSGLQLLLGNHDAAAIWQASPYQMSPSATKAILWTIDQLNKAQTRSITALDQKLQIHDMLFCHANPYSPGNWNYITSWPSAMRSFMASSSRITFVGHTHCPKVITRSSRLSIQFSDPPSEGALPLVDGARYIINCGSIGQPRDGNPDAGYVLCDTDKQIVEFIRFSYDVQGAARRIERAGLPGYLSERLFKGR